jgi:hypothetical protein
MGFGGGTTIELAVSCRLFGSFCEHSLNARGSITALVYSYSWYFRDGIALLRYVVLRRPAR